MTRGDTGKALAELWRGLRGLASVRWIRVVLILAVLVLGVRTGLNFMLARAIGSVAKGRDLECVWDSLSLSILSGRGELRGLRIGPPASEEGDEPPPLVEIEYGVFDLEVLDLVTGDLNILRAEIDGLDTRIERDANGTWNLERHFDLEEVLALFEPGEEVEIEEEEEDEPLDLSLPVEVEALRLQHTRLVLVDEALAEPIELAFELNARLSHLSAADRPARFSITVTGGHALDGANVEGELVTGADGLSLALQAQAGGLRPRALAPYLALVGVRAAAETIEASCRVEASLEVVGEARDALRAHASIADVVLTTDGAESFAVDELAFAAEHLGEDRAELGTIEVIAPRGRIELRADGALRAGGLDLLPKAGNAPAPSQSQPSGDFLELLRPDAGPGGSSLFVAENPGAPVWSVAGLRIEGGRFELVDHTTDPPTELVLETESVDVGPIVHDPTRTPPPITLAARLHAPGIAQSIAIDGSLFPFAPARTLELEVTVGEIGLEAVDPYLQGAGLERAIQGGSFHLALSGRAETDPESGVTTGALEVREVTLGDEAQLFGVRSFAVRDVRIDPDARVVRVGEVEVGGPKIAFQREPSGQFLGLGLRVLGRESLAEAGANPTTDALPADAPNDPGTPETEVEVPAASQPLAPPRIELARVAWEGSEIAFVDRAGDAPTRIELDELGFVLENLVLGGAPGDEEPPAATLRARLAAAGIVEEMVLEGTVRSRPGSLDLEAKLALTGTGIRGGALTPYLRELGADPVLQDGRAKLGLEARVRAEAGGLRVNASLTDALFSDGEQPLLGVERLALEDLVAGPAGLSIGRLSIERPTAFVDRDAEGLFLAAGLRFVPPADPEPAGAPAVETVAAPAALTLPALPPLRIDELTIEGATIGFKDAALQPGFDTQVTLGLSLSSLDTRAGPATFEARLSVPESVDELTFGGELGLGGEEIALAGAFAGSGLRAGPFARFLPPGISFDSGAATLEGRVRASLREAPEGGLAASFELAGVRWGEPDTDPWLGCERLAVEARRVDPRAGTITLGALRIEGAEIAAQRDAQGAIHALGARIAAVAPATSTRTALEAVPIEASAPMEQTESAGGLSAAPPRIELAEGCSLELARFTFRDASLGEDARPLTGGVRFALEPAVLIDPEPTDLPPLAWQLGGALGGLVESWELAGSAAPFASEPRLEASFAASGVRTAGLVELLPALADTIAGEVEDGRVEGSLDATLFVRRVRPFDLGIEQAFSGTVHLGELAFRDAPEGDVLIGLDDVQVDFKRIDPARQLVHVESIELRTPRCLVRRDANGLHALGLVVQPAAPAVDAAPEPPAPALEPEPEPETTPDAGAPPAAAGGFELRVDRLTVTGIDVALDDESIEPPLAVQLGELDAEVRRFTTRAFEETRPVSFNLFLGATAAGAAAQPVFGEVTSAGRLAFHPAPSGWAQVQLDALELPQFSGLTAGQGIEIADGALDVSVRMGVRPERGVLVDSSIVFTDLDLSEQEGGVLEQALALPMTLDSALFLLRNASGEHRLSVNFSVAPGGVSKSQLALAATGAITEVLASALAGAPIRLLTSIVPVTDDKDEEREPEIHTVAFLPGGTRLTAVDREWLDDLADRLESKGRLVARVTHELGAEDLARAEVLANPSRADCLALIRSLRQRKAEFGRHLDEQRLEARALYAIGSSDAATATEALRALGTELAGVERALDQVLEVLRSDSPRQKRKRTRTVARGLAELRLDEVAAVLRSRLGTSAAKRVEIGPVRATEATAAPESRVLVEILRR